MPWQRLYPFNPLGAAVVAMPLLLRRRRGSDGSTQDISPNTKDPRMTHSDKAPTAEQVEFAQDIANRLHPVTGQAWSNCFHGALAAIIETQEANAEIVDREVARLNDAIRSGANLEKPHD